MGSFVGRLQSVFWKERDAWHPLDHSKGGRQGPIPLVPVQGGLGPVGEDRCSCWLEVIIRATNFWDRFFDI